jgi:rubredoxin
MRNIRGDDMTMERRECQVCGHKYDFVKENLDGGMLSETPFESLLDNWVCPVLVAQGSMSTKI